MATEMDVIDKFSNLILGVQNADTLEPEEKAYLIEVLKDKLNTELICLEQA